MAEQMLSSAYNTLVSNMIGLQLSSIGTQQTTMEANTLATDANKQLTYAWTSCSETNPNDPGYTAEQALKTAEESNDPQSAVENWIKANLQGSSSNIDKFSSAFMATVENAYMKYCSKDKNQQLLGLITSYSSLLSAAGQSDEQSGQTVISTLNTLSQHFESDQGPLANASTTILDAANNFSSAMQSISA